MALYIWPPGLLRCATVAASASSERKIQLPVVSRMPRQPQPRVLLAVGFIAGEEGYVGDMKYGCRGGLLGEGYR